MAVVITNLTNDIEFKLSSNRIVTVPKADMSISARNNYVYISSGSLSEYPFGRLKLLYTNISGLGTVASAEAAMDVLENLRNGVTTTTTTAGA